jgi:hypothetical protein
MPATPLSDLTLFLFGDQHWHSVIGWHLAVFIAFYIGWHLSHRHHHPRRKK